MKYILMNRCKTFVLFFFLVAVAACNEDLGNYDYTKINSVKIGESLDSNGKLKEGIENKTCDAGSILKINPILEFSKGEDEGIFTYAWYYADNDWKLLREGRNLEVEIKAPIGTPGKSYTLAYEVINTKTNIPYRKIFSIQIINNLERGFLALCEHENGFDIDQIAMSGSNRFNLYKNVLEMSNSALPREGVKPYDILCFRDNMAPDPYNKVGREYSVYVLTNRYTTRILTEDYSWKPSYDISNSVEPNSYLDREYVKKGKPIVCEKMKVIHKSADAAQYPCPWSMFYLKDDDGKGNWYICTRHPMWIFYSNPMNDLRPNGGNRFEPAPYVVLFQLGALYFNAEKKVFMYESLPVSSQGVSYVHYTDPIPEGPDSDGPFNFKDPNEGLLYMGEQEGTGGSPWPSSGYAILKQANGSFKYIEIGSANSIGNFVNKDNKKRVSIFSANSGIGNAKFFARAPQSNMPFLYYATNDNRVYKADISNASAVVEDITSSVVPGNGYTEITVFKYVLPNADDIGTSGRTLAVATYNPSLGKTTGGRLEFFKIDNAVSGQLVLAKYPDSVSNEGDYQIDMSWIGLGRIVGLTYKQK